MANHKFYLGDSRYQTSYSSDFEVLEEDTGPPQSHAILRMKDDAICIIDTSELNDAGEFHTAQGYAVVLIKSGPDSKNFYTEHRPYRVRSISHHTGWIECEDPTTGKWLLAAPYDGRNAGSDRVVVPDQSTRSIAYQCPYLSFVENLDHYHDGNQLVELKLHDPASEAFLALKKYNEQLRSE
ncbi:MAG: hypothetical protein CL696_10020 [Chloroflexi bacterium]|nr:hypothetical protein [Chloroflexota bacterium]MDP6497953.1 hypothetical protein [Dehalococcoidia bacterium]